MGQLSRTIAELDDWQGEVALAVARLRDWLGGTDLADNVIDERLDRIRNRLGRHTMSIAFVAEFSRGKSELINALFFADMGQRIVPSSAGRTTMCPTELQWDDTLTPAIRLLPIESRLDDRAIAQWREDFSAWEIRSFDPARPAELKQAFEAVREVITVPPARAAELGFDVDPEGRSDALAIGADGLVEVPRWRYALVNVPHPLLASGLTIIDTPGLNAIGSEPELTINTIPNADAVLFVLAADAGVTRSDIDVWREHISPSHESGRLVVLNKIDGLWDDLKTDDEVRQEIDDQAIRVSQTLDIARERVFPVSAQKGLVARVQNNTALLARSGLMTLEAALADDLIPQQRRLAEEHVTREFEAVATQITGVLNARRRNSAEQLFELGSLRGKNREKMGQMATRIRMEREDFDRSLRQLQGLRSVFTKHSGSLLSASGIDRLKRHVRETRDLMSSSRLSLGLREGMNHLFEKVRDDITESESIIREIETMMAAMYRSFSTEHGLSLGKPPTLSLDGFLRDIDRLDRLQQSQFGASVMLTTEKWALMRRFMESVAIRIKDIYKLHGKEIQRWLRTALTPIETQVREHQDQLKRRLDSVKRVLEANESLDDRIAEIENEGRLAQLNLAACEKLIDPVRALLGGQPDLEPALELA